jgi:septum formation protein
MNPGLSRQGPFRALLPLVLASASPRRQALLAGQGLGFEVVPSTLKEPAPEPGEAPADYAARMARIKGQDIAARHPDKVIISADTIVVQDSSILGKPKDAAHALDMLSSLAGRWHEVMTGFCVLRHSDGVSLCRTVTTRVHMAGNSREMLQAYIGTKEPMDKAGAYGIQGIGAFLVDEVQGSYTNVVGLPLREILDILISYGVIIPAGA